jgi:hypothetical protein
VSAPEQSVTFYDSEGDWEAVLGIKQPPLSSDLEVFEQFDNVVTYARQLGCQSVAVETHYIDRDHIDDHSTFYSKSFESFGNFCKRVHFFSEPTETVQQKIRELHQSVTLNPESYSAECDAFSRQLYLGFTVVRPLRGSPVGRTLLRPPELAPPHTFPVRTYRAHLLGVALTVEGVPFQQQDEAVSACATTALWCSLQHARKYEDLASVSPARITQLASQYRLTLGRAMPSEGLTVEQMCAAIEGTGMAASLLRTTDYASTRAYVHAALRSGFTPVLVIGNTRTPDELHAVTVVGAELGATAKTFAAEGLREAADRVSALYIHDDRIGPYVRALAKRSRKTDQPMSLIIDRGPEGDEPWQVESMIVPMHPKIRLSFATLHDTIAASVVAHLEGRIPATSKDPIVLDTWMVLAQSYMRDLLTGQVRMPPAELWGLLSAVSLPRYAGVVSLTSREFGRLDLLVDTTSTARQVNFLAALYWPGRQSYHIEAQQLAGQLECPYFGTS